MTAATKLKREARARRQKALEKRRLASGGQPARILQVIEPAPALQHVSTPAAASARAECPAPPPADLETCSHREAQIALFRRCAVRASGSARAGFLHLVDLATHHERGFPNARSAS